MTSSELENQRWLAEFEWQEDVDAWRADGFELGVSLQWRGVLDSAIDAAGLSDEPDAAPRLATRFLTAGVPADEARAWCDEVAWDGEILELPRYVAGWRNAGFNASDAVRWGRHHDLEDAAAWRDAGWDPDEVSLLLIWLRAVDVVDGPGRDLVYKILEPSVAIAYARAGVVPARIPALEARRRNGEALSELAPVRSEAELVHGDLVRAAVAECTTRLSVRLSGPAAEEVALPRVESRWDDVDPVTETGLPDLGVSFDGAERTRLNNAHWRGRGFAVVEDHADEPWLDWSLELHDAITVEMERAARVGLGADETARCEVSWPPGAGLWDRGEVLEHDGDPCGVHGWVSRADCESCAEVVAPSLDLHEATWRWYIDVMTTVERDLGSGELETREYYRRHHMASLVIDPRLVSFAETTHRPPGY